MNTIILSAIGIVLLIAISFLLNSLQTMRSQKAARRFADIRKALARKSQWLVNPGNEVNHTVFRRRNLNSKLNIFPPNGNTPVL